MSRWPVAGAGVGGTPRFTFCVSHGGFLFYHVGDVTYRCFVFAMAYVKLCPDIQPKERKCTEHCLCALPLMQQ